MRPSAGRKLLKWQPLRYLSFVGLLLLLALGLPACTNQTTTSDPVAEGQRLYTIWCAGCHVTSSDGPDALGPRLGAMLARAEANEDGMTPEEWLLDALVNPNREVLEGYTPGMMPDYYGQRLTPAQLDALVQFMLAQ
jgi:cytochrome c